VRRFESVEEFASLDRDAWPRVAVGACRLAIGASGVDEQPALDALRTVEMRQSDPEAAILMRGLADRFDEEAWDAREVGDEDRYELMFRLSRAVSALAFALSEEPDEANYEAAYVVGTRRNFFVASPPRQAHPAGPAFGN
jgi:hypothetical protein